MLSLPAEGKKLSPACSSSYFEYHNNFASNFRLLKTLNTHCNVFGAMAADCSTQGITSLLAIMRSLSIQNGFENIICHRSGIC